MNTLMQLAERCEKATGPDRGLDWACHAAKLGNPRPTRPELDMSPAYTASLDAALELLPEGWEFIRLERKRSWPNDPRGDIDLLEAVVMETHGAGYSKTDAPTPALAICAAALRARAADRNTQDEKGLGG